MPDRVLLLWGKTTEDERFHPAIYHMIDVALVARALLAASGSRRIRNAIGYAWAGTDLDLLEAWLPFIIALHDIGKISAPFQRQQTTPGAKIQHVRLLHEGFDLGSEGDEPPTHSAVSAWWLNAHLAAIEPGVPRNTLFAIRDAAGGHHGWFANDLERAVGGYLARHEPASWDELRHEGYWLMRAALGPAAGSLAAIGQPRRVRPATAALTGLTVIADWVASNVYYFRPDCSSSLDRYLEISGNRALDALAEIGLITERKATRYAGFQATFPGRADVRDLQIQIDALDAADLLSPGLYIIEAPTGEGKTEAALALARRLSEQGASDELYFGLPTMATSNQMFQRLTDFFERLYGKDGVVKLAHGQAALVERELRWLARRRSSGDSDPSQRTSAEWAGSDEQTLQWFGSSKRALLAPFGVGTVDQVELSGLNVRHAMLRLFGLAGKVVIIDEVHAYDIYMSTILEHTLGWLASMGASVILLSATLPIGRHQALARRYIAGLRAVRPERVDVAPVSAYPALAIYGASYTRQLAPVAFRSQSLAIQFVADQDIVAQAQRLLELTAHGGAVARICNRVDDAQQLYAELRYRNIAGLTVLLLHARYPLDERQTREEAIDIAIGKATKRVPGDRLIVIGTQVLEQSLDYDVDVMVSDLAPIDLLLQRAGRLHRHARQRPTTHRTPILYTQCEIAPDGLPEVGHWKNIYAPFVLWQTWLTLQARRAEEPTTIELPRDYRPLIEAVYAVALPEPPADHPFAAPMAAARAVLAAAQAKQQEQARQRLTPDPLSRDAIVRVDDIQFTEDDEGALSGWQIAKTRLGERVTVIPLYNHAGRLTLDRAGQEPLGVIAKDDVAAQNRLLRRSLPISDPRLVAYFGKEGKWPLPELPPLLKHTPPLVLDQDGRATRNDVRLHLDPELGLVIEKEKIS